MDAARRLVAQWLDEHPGGSLGQMAGDLKGNYPDHPEEMAAVLRGFMVAELRHRTSPPPEFPPDPAASVGAARRPGAGS